MENVKAFVAIDFEYLYLAQYDTPCAVGLVKVINNVVIEKYYSFIHQPAQEATLAPKNGITPEMLVDAPHYDKVYSRMVEFIGDLPLVAHNASVERKVLSETPCPDHLPFLADGAFIDTDYLSGHRSLQALCEEYNIPLNHHNALSDAEACAEVYLRLCGEEKVKEVVRNGITKKVYHVPNDSKGADSYGSIPEEQWVCTDFPFKGKHICVSGEYRNFPDRADLRRELMKRGVIVDKTIVNATEILVCGSAKPAGPAKMKQMLGRGGKLVSEEIIIELLHGDYTHADTNEYTENGEKILYQRPIIIEGLGEIGMFTISD